MHIVLLGDSVFDNAMYTSGGPAVVDHLRARLGPGQEVTLLAVDGDRVADVPSQLRRLHEGGTHIFLSVGGNDALDHVGLLNERVRNVGEGMVLLGSRVNEFEGRYREMVRAVTSEVGHVHLCTIYNGSFGPEGPMVSSAVLLFNDAIQRVATAFFLPVLELRDLLNEPAHYANPIEPNVEGGRILAEEILRRVRE